MSLTVRYLEDAKKEIKAELMGFSYDEKTLFLEFARIVSENGDTGEADEIEVVSRVEMPIESAVDNLTKFLQILVKYEREHKNGLGIPLPEQKEGD